MTNNNRKETDSVSSNSSDDDDNNNGDVEMRLLNKKKNRNTNRNRRRSNSTGSGDNSDDDDDDSNSSGSGSGSGSDDNSSDEEEGKSNRQGSRRRRRKRSSGDDDIDTDTDDDNNGMSSNIMKRKDRLQQPKVKTFSYDPLNPTAEPYKRLITRLSGFTILYVIMGFQFLCVFQKVCYQSYDSSGNPSIPDDYTDGIVPVILIVCLILLPLSFIICYSKMINDHLTLLFGLTVINGIISISIALFVFIIGCICFQFLNNDSNGKTFEIESEIIRKWENVEDENENGYSLQVYSFFQNPQDIIDHYHSYILSIGLWSFFLSLPLFIIGFTSFSLIRIYSI